jgi:hypothetical protein
MNFLVLPSFTVSTMFGGMLASSHGDILFSKALFKFSICSGGAAIIHDYCQEQIRIVYTWPLITDICFSNMELSNPLSFWSEERFPVMA